MAVTSERAGDTLSACTLVSRFALDERRPGRPCERVLRLERSLVRSVL